MTPKTTSQNSSQLTIKEFIKELEGIFEQTKPGTITPDTCFRELEDWSSIKALFIIALIDTEYNVVLTNKEFRSSHTIGDLFNIVKSKS